MKPNKTQAFKDGKVKLSNLYAIKNNKIYKGICSVDDAQ